MKRLLLLFIILQALIIFVIQGITNNKDISPTSLPVYNSFINVDHFNEGVDENITKVINSTISDEASIKPAITSSHLIMLLLFGFLTVALTVRNAYNDHMKYIQYKNASSVDEEEAVDDDAVGEENGVSENRSGCDKVGNRLSTASNF